MIQRAYRAVAILKRRDNTRFFDILRSVLYPEDIKVPDQTKALAETWWPLVLSTNYDDLLFRAVYGKSRGGFLILGRSSRDCNRVLASLTTPSPPILWALQGFLPSKNSPFYPSGSNRINSLQEELVLGHEEYRQVTHRIPWFRRAFAEVFRSRSLLFLGAGLADPYLLDLFGEILEMTGASPSPHFAFLEEGQMDPQILVSRYNIIGLEYPSKQYETVSEWLRVLNKEINTPRPKQISLSFSFDTPGHLPASEGNGDLTIVRGTLPKSREGDCVGISAGRHDNSPVVGLNLDKFFPDCAQFLAHRWLVPCKLAVCTENPADPSRDSPLFLLVARDNTKAQDNLKSSDARHLGAIRDVCQHFLDAAVQRHFSRARMQLLAAGPGRVFPPTFAFVQQVRAIKEWFGKHKGSSLNGFAVVLHVVDPSVWSNILSGRLNLQELLQCDDMRLVIEVSINEAQELQEFRYVPASMSLRELAKGHDIPDHGWSVELIPSPTRERTVLHLEEIMDDTATLEWFGAVPGSTIRFFRKVPVERTTAVVSELAPPWHFGA